MRIFLTTLIVLLVGVVVVEVLGILLWHVRHEPTAATMSAEANCGSIDVWMPESNNGPLSAPTINDPNAKVTMRITPPADPQHADPDCTVWHWHHGAPTPQAKNP